VYRVPVVLCDLGGKARQEVARQLRVPEGTVSSRLARGRELLRKRLARRGLMLTGAALVPALADAASAAVPSPLLRATLDAGVLVAAGRAGTLAAPVASLLRPVLREMVVARLKVAALVVLTVGLLGAVTGLVAHQVWPRNPPPPSQTAAPAPRPVEAPRPATVVRFADIERPGGPDPTEPVNVGGTLFFAANDRARSRQLWKIVPTRTGPQPALVKGVGAGLNPQFLTDVHGTLFFVPGGREGRELWKSDGTAEGTVRLKRFNPPGLAFPSMGAKPLFAVGRRLFFVASDAGHTSALWKSDGTSEGTVIVKDIIAADALKFPRRMADVNGTLYFVADDGVHGAELWKSDGTAAGTVMVKDICPGVGGGAPLFLTNVNGTLFFTARDTTHGRELWKSDGTAAGTVMVKDINPGRAGAFPDIPQIGDQIGNLTVVGRTLFFAADDGVHGRRLWKSDGTADGTVTVKDVNPGSDVQLLTHPDAAMVGVNGTLYFVADDGTLWKSDGTEAGTVPVKRLFAEAARENHASLTDVNGTLFVVTVEHYREKGAVAVRGVELWKSDGTEAGTVPVRKVNPGRDDGLSVRYVGDLTTVGDTLYFGAAQPRRTPFEEWWVELWQMPVPRRPGG
jgi:ELWxxDGT repeat protein